MSFILDNPAVREAALPVSVEQYHQLGQAGIIAENTELLRGVIVEKVIKSPKHSWLVQFLAEWLRSRLPAGVHVRQEQPLTLADSEPESDIAVVTGTPDDYRGKHPSTALLVIEVAVSSADIDREKADLYAAVGVSEYVIVLPDESAAEVFREPSDSSYDEVARLAPGATLELQSCPGLSLKLAQLFSD